jgi:hypothetical protein
MSEPLRPSPVKARNRKCARCGHFPQTIDFLVITPQGLAHRQCAKGAN